MDIDIEFHFNALQKNLSLEVENLNFPNVINFFSAVQKYNTSIFFVVLNIDLFCHEWNSLGLKL